nr:MAG TPA: tyrosine-protein kinase [Caudoviricetes sp.]
MKKYFMKDSGEELKFGDMIELDFTKDTKNGHICHHHLECKFVPGLIPMLLEQEIIKEEEFKDENTDTLSNENYDIAKDIISIIEALSLKVQKMESTIVDLNKIIRKLQHNAKKSA